MQTRWLGCEGVRVNSEFQRGSPVGEKSDPEMNYLRCCILLSCTATCCRGSVHLIDLCSGGRSGGRAEERYQPPGWVGFFLPVLREQLGKLPTRSAHQRLSLGRREPLLPGILQELTHDVHVVVVIRVLASVVCRTVVVAFLLVAALVQVPIRAFTFLLFPLLLFMFKNRLLLRRARFPPRTRGGGTLSRCTFSGGWTTTTT